jgi:hypothetical protein
LNTENQLPRLPASASGVFYSEYFCMWPPIAKMPKTFFTNSPVIPYGKTEENPELLSFPMYFDIPTPTLSSAKKTKDFQNL